MKILKTVNELDEKVLCWQADDSFVKKLRENPSFSPKEIQSLIEELTLRRVESTELRAVRQELLEIRQQYRELYDFLSDGYLILDENNLIKEANTAISNDLKQKKEVLIGQSLFSYVAQNSQDAFNLFLIDLFQRKCLSNYEIILQANDGNEFLAIFAGRVRKDLGGRPEIHILISRNKTVSQYRDKPLIIVDLDGNLSFVNKCFYKVAGYSYRELIYQSIADFLLEGDRSKIMTNLLKVRMGIPVNSKITFSLICKNRTSIQFCTRPLLIKNNGQILGFIATLHRNLNQFQNAKKIRLNQVCLRTTA